MDEDLREKLIHEIKLLKKNKSSARGVCKYNSSCNCSECMTGKDCHYHGTFLKKKEAVHKMLEDYVHSEISHLLFYKEDGLEREIPSIVNKYYKSIYSYAIDLLQFDKAEEVLQSMKNELIQLWYVNNISYLTVIADNLEELNAKNNKGDVI